MSPTISWLKSHFYTRENTILGRQRLVLFEAVGVISVILTIISFFTLPRNGLIRVVDVGTIIITIALLVLYNTHRLSVRWAATSLYILIQLELSMQLIYFSTLQTLESAALIIQGSFLSLLLISISLVSFLRYSPSIISILSLLTFSFCYIIFPNAVITAFAPIYLVVLLGAILYDFSATRPLLMMDAYQRHQGDEYLEFLYATGLTHEDVKNITKLSRNNADQTERTRNLLSLMNSRARKNIMDSVLLMKTENENSRELLLRVFPALTPSQISICQLVLQGKKLSDICITMGKSESNISSQRSRIRTALELKPEDNLKDVLEERIEVYMMQNRRDVEAS